MRFLRNPNITIAVLAVYTALMYIFLFPQNKEMSNGEKWATIGASVAILSLLWVLLRKREKLRKQREEDMKNNGNL